MRIEKNVKRGGKRKIVHRFDMSFYLTIDILGLI